MHLMPKQRKKSKKIKAVYRINSKLKLTKRNAIIFTLVFALVGVTFLVYSFALGNDPCEALTARDLAVNSKNAQQQLKNIPGVGRSCQLKDGLFKLPIDSKIGFVYSHGRDNPIVKPHDKIKIDRSNPTIAYGYSFTDGRTMHLRSTQVRCTTSDYRNALIYAHTSDAPSRFDSVSQYIYQAVQAANGMLDWEAGTMGGTAAFKFACTNGQPNMARMMTVSSADMFDLSKIYYDVVVKHGYNNPKIHYWVFIDSGQLGSAGSTGGSFYWFPYNSNPTNSPYNGNSTDPLLAITYNNGGTRGGPMLLHEVGHIMGAVQPPNNGNPAAPDYICNIINCTGISPHDSEIGDVMNYGAGPVQHCVGEIRFDCNHNSYFNLHPPTGSWVSKYWQVGSPLNRYTYYTY